MHKVEMIIADTENESFSEEHEFVKLKDVDFDDMIMIMKYAFNSGYDVYFRKQEEAE